MVTWVNELKDASGNFLPHLLPVDPTLHWANPPAGTNSAANGTGARDSRPTFATTPGRYTGPVPIVPHVHGMERVEDWSDGYAEAWFLPDAANIPAGYAKEDTWYDFFKSKAAQAGVADWGAGRATFRYPNTQRPSTAWYHDHTLSMTRLNVYAGPAGFYIVRSASSDDYPTIMGSSSAAVLPGPGPGIGANPFGLYYEIPIAIQDRRGLQRTGMAGPPAIGAGIRHRCSESKQPPKRLIPDAHTNMETTRTEPPAINARSPIPE